MVFAQHAFDFSVSRGQHALDRGLERVVATPHAGGNRELHTRIARVDGRDLERHGLARREVTGQRAPGDGDVDFPADSLCKELPDNDELANTPTCGLLGIEPLLALAAIWLGRRYSTSTRSRPSKPGV